MYNSVHIIATTTSGPRRQNGIAWSFRTTSANPLEQDFTRADHILVDGTLVSRFAPIRELNRGDREPDALASGSGASEQPSALSQTGDAPFWEASSQLPRRGSGRRPSQSGPQPQSGTEIQNSIER